MVNTLLRKTGIALLSGGLMLLSLSGCKNSDEIGLNLTPPGERFHYVVDSTAVVTANTIRQDSITSEKRATSLLGCMNDPIFGRTTASLMTQLRLSSNEVDFGENPQIDSVVILLKYKGYYGDTTQLQSLKVYELNKDLYFDSTYYSNQKMDGFFEPAASLANFSYFPKPDKDSILIRLSDDFGNRLLHTDTAYLSNNSTWLSHFKGLYFESQQVDQGGCMTYLNFTGGKSRMQLYYHNNTTDSLKYEIVINTNCSYVNLYQHDYSGSPIHSLINDSVNTHPEIYVQSMAGLRSHVSIKLPDELVSKMETGVTINKAELIIPVADDPTAKNFGVPTSIRVFNAGATGKNEFIDDLLLGEAYYGGAYQSATSSYTFNIGRHIQKILHPDPDKRIVNNGLFLVITDERITGNRLVLKNGMKLVITYTALN